MLWILTNWKLCLIGMAIALLGIQTLRLNSTQAERDLAIANLDTYKAQAITIATQAKKDSDKAIKEANDAIPQLLEQAKTQAYKNYQARYGVANASCRLGVVGLSMPAGIGSPETLRTESPDGASGERLVIEACARDAGRLDLWREWAIANELKVE